MFFSDSRREGSQTNLSRQFRDVGMTEDRHRDDPPDDRLGNGDREAENVYLHA
jgi:hypothetical protein